MRVWLNKVEARIMSAKLRNKISAMKSGIAQIENNEIAVKALEREVKRVTAHLDSIHVIPDEEPLKYDDSSLP